MKVFQKSFLVLLTIASFNFSMLAGVTSNEPSTSVSQELRKEITQLVKSPKLDDGDQLEARVSFIINDDQEIVVLYVDTDEDYIDNFIKRKLNYHRVKTNGVKSNSKYSIKIKFKSE
jgi:hypothetical protein